MKSAQFLSIISNEKVVGCPPLFIELMKNASIDQIKDTLEQFTPLNDRYGNINHVGCSNGNCVRCVLSKNNLFGKNLINEYECYKKYKIYNKCTDIINISALDDEYHNINLLLDMKRFIDEQY